MDVGCWAWGGATALGWPEHLGVGIHLVLVLSDRPVEMEGKGVTLEGDLVGQL